MAYLLLDDGFAENPKIEAISDSALRLHLRALCYCARNLTDGKLPKSAFRGHANQVRELVSAGLWEQRLNSWQIHDYLEHNRSREYVLRERAAARARMKRLRSPERSPERSGEQAPHVPPEFDDPTPKPIPKKKKESVSRDALEVAEYLRDALLSHTPDHKCGLSAQHEKWAVDIDRAIRLDKRTPEALMGAAKFAHELDPKGFWRSIIQSGLKLRHHFDALSARASQSREVRNAQAARDWLKGDPSGGF